MKSRSNAVGAVLSILLAAAAAYFHFLTPTDLDEHFRTAVAAVQRMGQLGTQWGVETARVRADPAAGFDDLTAFVPRLEQAKEELSHSFARITGLPEPVAADADVFLSEAESLRERVERFKTAWAVVRNSERHFPAAGNELLRRARQAASGGVARDAESFVRDLDVFLAAPSEAERERLSAHLAVLAGKASPETPRLAAALADFAAHAEVLLDLGRIDDLVREITSSPMLERSETLAGSLEAARDERRRIRALYRQGAIAFGAGVPLVWIVVGLGRRFSSGKRSRADAPATTPAAGPREQRVAKPPSRAERGPEPGITPGEGHAAPDLIESLQSSGALAGLVAQSIRAYTRRMGEDLAAVRNMTAGARSRRDAREAMKRWKRLLGDNRRLDFIGQRLGVLARQVAPHDRRNVDVNECLSESLNDAGVEHSCKVVLRLGDDIPPLPASETEVRLLFAACIEYVLHALRNMDRSEATLEVSTVSTAEEMGITFVHGGEWLPPEQRGSLFVPFYASRDQKAGLGLPAALYLARKYRGTVGADTLADGRTAVRVRLPAPARTAGVA